MTRANLAGGARMIRTSLPNKPSGCAPDISERRGGRMAGANGLGRRAGTACVVRLFKAASEARGGEVQMIGRFSNPLRRHGLRGQKRPPIPLPGFMGSGRSGPRLAASGHQQIARFHLVSGRSVRSFLGASRAIATKAQLLLLAGFVIAI